MNATRRLFLGCFAALALSACATAHHEPEPPTLWMANVIDCQAWYSLAATTYELELLCDGERAIVEHGSYEMHDGYASFEPAWNECGLESAYELDAGRLTGRAAIHEQPHDELHASATPVASIGCDDGVIAAFGELQP